MDSDSKVDLSALYEGIQDELVKLEVLTDDNYTIVASHDGSGVFVDRVNPRMEIVITPKDITVPPKLTDKKLELEESPF